MHKIWLLFDPRRALIAAAVGVMAVALLIHFVVLSSPRYADHLGWGAPAAVAAQPARPATATR
jgi:light-harvesting complex 1 alpha chain